MTTLDRPDGHQLETLLFEPLDDLPHQTSLDPVRFDHDEGSLCLVRTGGLQLEPGGGDGGEALSGQHWHGLLELVLAGGGEWPSLYRG